MCFNIKVKKLALVTAESRQQCQFYLEELQYAMSLKSCVLIPYIHVHYGNCKIISQTCINALEML